MADLQLAPARERSALPALLLAVVVLAAVGFAVFYFNPHKVADLRVMDVQTFAPHTQMSALPGADKHSMRVLNGAAPESEDDLYVIASVSLTDHLRLPLFLTGAVAHVTFADGSTAAPEMISVRDQKRLQVIFPDLIPLTANPIADGDEVDPGKTRVGTVVLQFPGRTAEAWKTKHNATLTLQLRNQGPQTTTLP